VISVSEMANFAKREVYNQLKDWIAAPPMHVSVNKKNLQPFTIPNIQIWTFFTNYDNAIALDEDDRRFWVHRSCIDSPPRAELGQAATEQYFTDFYSWLNRDQGAAKVAGWLKQRDISAFNPAARPPMTSAKREMLDLSQPAALKYLRALFQEGEPLHGRSVVTFGDLLAVAGQDFTTPEGVEKYPMAALKAEGFRPMHRVRLSTGMRQLWGRDPSGLLGQLSPTRLRDRYETEVSQKVGARP
jgi:hypothetical protein